MSQRVSDEKLADWYARWPSTLPTSVPHEQVRMLIADLRAARAEIAALKARLDEADEMFRSLGTRGHDLDYVLDLMCRGREVCGGISVRQTGPGSLVVDVPPRENKP